MQNPKVSIIILNWNGWQDTVDCLNSLKNVSYPNYEIIVVDNASSGKDIQLLKNQFGNSIRIIVNEKNIGFAKGNNIGIKQVLEEKESKYILLLNNDTLVEKDFLQELVNVAESKNGKAAILGPKMYYWDYKGKKNVIWFGGGEINWKKYPGYHHRNEKVEDKDNFNANPEKTDWISGACMLINCELENPFLNSDFYFGCEDIDKCLGVKRQGYEVVYVPSSIIWHKVSASREKNLKSKIKEVLTNFKFLRKNYKKWPVLVPTYFIQILKKILVN